MQIAERPSKRCLWRDLLALLVEEGAEVIDDRLALLEASESSLLGRIASELGVALDGEERRHLPEGVEGDLVSSASRLGEVAPRVSTSTENRA